MITPYYEDDLVRIYHGDNREILPALAGEPVDLILTDPPYGIDVTNMRLGSGKRIIYRGEGDWDKEPPDLAPLLARGVNTVIWGGNYFALPASRCWFVWDKGTGDNSFADCELAWTNRDGVVKKFSHLWSGVHAREKMEADRIHPTQKPIALMRWCIGFYPDAQLILDPYMGSGTTLRAAKDMGRKAIGIEQDEHYCEAAARRMMQSALPLG